jgi:hypothetical protein
MYSFNYEEKTEYELQIFKKRLDKEKKITTLDTSKCIVALNNCKEFIGIFCKVECFLECNDEISKKYLYYLSLSKKFYEQPHSDSALWLTI